MSKLSIIIPVYFNENNLNLLYEDIKINLISKIDCEYEIIMVDDGSTDKSWDVICNLSMLDKNIKGIRLSKNFGSHAAILCGLSHSTGSCAAIKAADLQEPSELIIDMYNKWKNGYNVVLGIRRTREDSSFFANLYYYLTQKYILNNMPKSGFDIFLIDRKVINVLKTLDEKNSALTAQILWSGFKTTTVPYDRKKRQIGKSKWTLRKKINLTMNTFFSFSTLPISIVSSIGFLSTLLSIIWILYLIIVKITVGIPVQGYTTLFIFQLFSFGVIMLTLALLGGYLWRTFDASRNRPVYIIEDTINISNKRID